MSEKDFALMAHLMRRAGFGATHEELEKRVAKGYEATVEELLYPELQPPALEDEDLLKRYHVDGNNLMGLESCQTYWLYRMVNTRRPLEEKMALFYHSVFATGYTKLNHPKAILNQIEMFRRLGMGSFHRILVEISKDPAMIFWLDNKDNHKGAVNENYGRELLELFSMGVGNYTEDDVRQASHAFTGWTIADAALHQARSDRDSIWPYGRLDWHFQYRDDDHDDDEKEFLGHRGPFNGEDIIDIVCRHPATGRFVARHLYNFFVADEPQVPAWNTTPPRDPEAVETLADTLNASGYDMRTVMRTLLNSDFFKEAAFAKIKSPTEFVVGTARLTGGYSFPQLDDLRLAEETGNMGQQLLDPPSVEGWHTGVEWVTTGSLVSRVNFAAAEFADPQRPGVESMIRGIRDRGAHASAESLVDECLDLLGYISVSEETRNDLVAHAEAAGDLSFETPEDARESAERVAQLLQVITATTEYQLA